MIDALFERLNVPVKHRTGAAAAHLMPDAMHLEPFLGRFFAPANFVAHSSVKDFRAAASDGTEAALAQKLERIGDRHLEDSLGEMANFDRSECFNMKFWIERSQSTEQIEILIFL